MFGVPLGSWIIVSRLQIHLLCAIWQRWDWVPENYMSLFVSPFSVEVLQMGPYQAREGRRDLFFSILLAVHFSANPTVTLQQ